MQKKDLITKFTKLISKKVQSHGERYISIHLVTNDLIMGKLVEDDKFIKLCNAVFVKFGSHEDTGQSYMYFIKYNPLSNEENIITVITNDSVVSANRIDQDIIDNYNDFIKKDMLLRRNMQNSLDNKKEEVQKKINSKSDLLSLPDNTNFTIH